MNHKLLWLDYKVSHISKFIPRFYYILFLFLILTTGCTEKFNALRYYPMEMEYIWDYDNFSMKIEEITEIDEHSQRITAVYYDSIGSKVWTEEIIRRQENLYWQNFQPYLQFMPHVTFDPPIQISPISDKLGDTKTIMIREISRDSVDIYNDINVNYEIESIEGINIASGYYPDCIKMRISINYLVKAEKTYFNGNYYYWFAKGIGPVKVVTPSTSAELRSADLGIRKFP